MVLYCLDVSKLNVDEMSEYVSKERLEKTNKLLKYEDKQLSIGAELLLNYGLNKMGITNPEYSLNPNGKPYISNYDRITFNISHSHHFVAVAITRLGVGVDIEYITSDIDLDISKKFFTSLEHDYIINSEKPFETFFKIWVLKESYLKMINKGFEVELNDFSVINSEGFIDLVHGEAYTSNIKFSLFTNDEYFLATCSRIKENELTEVTLNDIHQYLHLI